MNISGNESTGITLSYQIPEDEQVLAEGEMSVAVVYEDIAGNTLTMTSVNEGKVTYDRTKPVIDVANAFSGFTASDVVFDIAITDAHIDTGITKVTVNGEARTAGNGLELNGNIYRTSFKNDKEGTYTIKIEAADLAGNAADPVVYTVTVDKTNPEITTTKESSEAGYVFNSGVTISDLIDISDANSVKILCTIADGTSFTEWDIDEPIETEGRKKITITAYDMAGNPSNVLELDIIIDKTCPEPIIKNSLDGKVLENGQTFTDPVTLYFSLRDLAYDKNSPDRFTMLQIVTPDGTVVDLLSTGDGDYSYYFKDPGTYLIFMSAVDSLGNETGEIEYSVTIEEEFIDAIKNFFNGPAKTEAESDTQEQPEKQNKTKLIAIGGGVGLGVILLAAGAVAVIKKSKRSHRR